MEARKRGLVGVVSVAAVLAMVGAVAWACTPLASIRATPAQGAPGTNVTLTGSSFDPKGASVNVYWGGASGVKVASAPISATGTFTANFAVPANAFGGNQVITAVPANGSAAPTNAMFVVQNAPLVPPPSLAQGTEEAPTVNEPVSAEAPAASPVATASPAPAAQAAPRVRPAPTRTAAPAPRAAAPAPVTPPAPAAPAAAAPAVEETPTPVVEPAPAAAAPTPAAPPAAPARRSVMVSMASESDGSPALAIALVGIGLALALGASAVVLAGRRDRKAPATAKR